MTMNSVQFSEKLSMIKTPAAESPLANYDVINLLLCDLKSKSFAI